MDKTSYHSVLLNKPTSTNSKSETTDWLKENKTTLDPAKTKAELL
jgi:hypothetical protein